MSRLEGPADKGEREVDGQVGQGLVDESDWVVGPAGLARLDLAQAARPSPMPSRARPGSWTGPGLGRPWLGQAGPLARALGWARTLGPWAGPGRGAGPGPAQAPKPLFSMGK